MQRACIFCRKTEKATNFNSLLEENKGSMPFSDFFDLKPKHVGPWNNEAETLVLRYCDCPFKCPVCYAVGPSYLHRLMGLEKPLEKVKSVSKSQRLDYPPTSWDIWPLDKLRKREYVRIQGGEPLFDSPLNPQRIRMTAKITVDILNFARQQNLGKCVVVIQTNGFSLGSKSKSEEFIQSLVNFAENTDIKEGLRTGENYRVAIEISYKSPNEEDFAVFSGTRNPSAWKSQIKAYWNLMELLHAEFEKQKGFAVYPIAGFLMPLGDRCGLVPISKTGAPLFHKDTWDLRFGEIIQDFDKRLSGGRYHHYVHLLNKNELLNGETAKIRAETLEMTGYQKHVPSVYSKFDEFRNHFDTFKTWFKLGPQTRYCDRYQTYKTYRDRLGLKEVKQADFYGWFHEMGKWFYDLSSSQYYPQL